MILLTAGVTGIIYMLFFQDVALMGASGIAFMLILLSPFANVERGKIPLTLIVVVILYFGREIYSGMFDSDNIAQSAHLIGGICGAVFGYFLSNRANYRSAAK